MSDVCDNRVDAAWQAFKPHQHGTDRYKREGLRAALTAAMTLTDPDCPQSVRDQINGAERPHEWHEANRTSGDVMLYTLRQDGWRKGKPVMVNDVTVLIEAAHGSTTDIRPIVNAIRAALNGATRSS